MVKLPQSTLGYMVDVKQVFPAHPLDSTGKQQLLSGKKNVNRRAKTPCNGSSHSIRALSKKLRFAAEIEDLKNASKQGLDIVASSLTRGIATNHFRIQTHNDNFFFCMVRCLVIPDIENRSALYYAAHSGCEQLVKTYLALLVLPRTIRQPDRVARLSRMYGDSMTIRQWFDRLGYIDFFGPKEFDICVLNALNDKTKALFKHESYTLAELRDTVMKSPWSSYVPNMLKQHLQTTRKSSKPRLVVDDDASSYFDDIASDYDDFHQDGDCKVASTVDKKRDEEDEIVMQLYHLMLNCETSDSSTSVEGGHCLISTDNELAPVCDNFDEEWSEVQSVASDGFVEIDGTNHGEDDDCSWSVVSDVASVQSMATTSTTVSYSDALRFGAKLEPAVPLPRISEDTTLLDTIKDTKAVLATPRTEDEEECCALFDDFFFREGQKGSRGGKSTLMFRGNQRTAPSRAPRRHRW